MKQAAVVSAGLVVLALVFWLKVLHASEVCQEMQAVSGQGAIASSKTGTNRSSMRRGAERADPAAGVPGR